MPDSCLDMLLLAAAAPQALKQMFEHHERLISMALTGFCTHLPKNPQQKV